MCACSPAVDAMINHHVHTQRWRIANVSKLPTAIGARVVSDQFEAFGRAWEIGLFPGGMKPENKDSVQAYLRMTTETAIPLLVKFEFALIDHAGERHTFFVDFSEVSTHKAKCATLGLRATLFDAAKGFAVGDAIQLECYMEALLQLQSYRTLGNAASRVAAICRRDPAMRGQAAACSQSDPCCSFIDAGIQTQRDIEFPRHHGSFVAGAASRVEVRSFATNRCCLFLDAYESFSSSRFLYTCVLEVPSVSRCSQLCYCITRWSVMCSVQAKAPVRL